MASLDLLAAAKRGDEQAFGQLIEPFRRELLAHNYRMLGSLQDAEDALQEGLVRAWKGLAKFEALPVAFRKDDVVVYRWPPASR